MRKAFLVTAIMKKIKKDSDDQRIHLRASGDEVSIFQNREKKREKKWGTTVLLIFIYAGVFFFSLFFVTEYSVSTIQNQFSLAYMLRMIRQSMEAFYHFLSGESGYGGMDYQIIHYVLVGIVGASLAACGALLQGTFRNVLAGPSTLGIQSGGTLGNMIYVLFFCSTEVVVVYSYEDIQRIVEEATFFTRNTQFLLVLAGCIFGVFFVVSIATIAGKGKVSTSAMILAGTVFSSIIGSFCALIQYYIILKNPSDTRITLLRSLSMGSVSGYFSPEKLMLMLAVLIPCIIIMGLMAGKMNILAFGEETARTMGMNVKRYKLIMMGASTLMTAVVTAGVGHIGFLGFMVPQVTRKMVGPDFRRLFPTSVIFGALLLTLIYDVARVFFMTDSLNVFTSAIGSFVMLIILLKKKGGRD